LFHAGGHDNPATLRANADKSFQGSIVLGMGFTFDDSDPDGVATPLAEMRRLIEANSRNAERIFPYIGGEEVNNSPTHTYHRYVINLGQIEEDEAWAGWPELMRIVEKKVKPERDRLQDNPDGRRRKKYWWQWGRYTPALFEAQRTCARVLVTNCGATPHLAFTWMPPQMVFAHSLAIVALERDADFAILQSRCHEVWARVFASSLEDRLRYTPTDCFETFPFPINVGGGIDEVGREYFETRASIMVARNEGLTKTYNRFNDPNETDADIAILRSLHNTIDRAVLDAYGWDHIQPSCEFITEHGEDDEGHPGQKYRYRWPDNVRDEVLARLLALNAERAEEEQFAGAAAAGRRTAPRATRGKRGPTGQGGLFDRS
jgi:hypothetical protein